MLGGYGGIGCKKGTMIRDSLLYCQSGHSAGQREATDDEEEVVLLPQRVTLGDWVGAHEEPDVTEKLISKKFISHHQHIHENRPIWACYVDRGPEAAFLKGSRTPKQCHRKARD